MGNASGAYAIGRVRVLERKRLRLAGVERLAAVGAEGTAEEFARVLVEFGWGEAETPGQMEALCSQRVRAALRLLRDNSPDAAVTSIFAWEYDVLNLKALLKARLTGLAVPELAQGGIISLETLRRAVASRSYSALPKPFQGALSALEKRLSVRPEPIDVDSTLDSLLLTLASEAVTHSISSAMRRYVMDWSDLSNVRAAMRTVALQRDQAFLAPLLVPGGHLGERALLGILDRPKDAERLLRECGFCFGVLSAAKDWQDGQGLMAYEREMDKHLLSLFTANQGAPTGVDPLIAYYLRCKREATLVRTALSALGTGVDRTRLTERLRDLYG